MERMDRRVIFGVLLVLAGLAFLVQNMGFFQITGFVWTVLFALGGLAFLSALINNRANWWAAIPGIILLDLAAVILMDQLFPGSSGRWTGSFFLAGIGAAFVVVYLLNPTNWWAIIPGGVMVTLAVVAGLDQVGGLETGGIFFLGLAATFALLTILPAPGQRQSWAWIPALALAVMGVVILASETQLIGYLWPVVLIVLGGVLLLRGFTRRQN